MQKYVQIHKDGTRSYGFFKTNQSLKQSEEINENFESQITQIRFEDICCFPEEQEFCEFLAVNQEGTILLFAFLTQIKVFAFIDDDLKEIQTITEHEHKLCASYFFQKTNQFVTGDISGLMLLWANNSNKEWYCQQTIQPNGHLGIGINQIISNKEENMLISCSNDKKIQFWGKEATNNWQLSSVLLLHRSCVYSISLNENEKLLVSCDYYSIVISQHCQDQKWKKLQRIQLVRNGYEPLFLFNDLFIFQPNHSRKIITWQYDERNNLFKETNSFKCQMKSYGKKVYPISYNKNLHLLILKTGRQTNFITTKDGKKFKTNLIIDFRISEHLVVFQGEYLFCWDDNTKSIQVKKITII